MLFRIGVSLQRIMTDQRSCGHKNSSTSAVISFINWVTRIEWTSKKFLGFSGLGWLCLGIGVSVQLGYFRGIQTNVKFSVGTPSVFEIFYPRFYVFVNFRRMETVTKKWPLAPKYVTKYVRSTIFMKAWIFGKRD